MADFCAVCDKSMNFMTKNTIQGIDIHYACIPEFNQNPEKYGGISLQQRGKEDSETVKIQIDEVQQKRIEREANREEKSVYIKGGISVKSFDMPFGEMVGFMVKWALASIPAFIILAFIFAIFFAIFGSLFF
tara:strand:+ start:256 stop:651 length:396 start_codon:yes stop_codon:yes gene_type:complete